MSFRSTKKYLVDRLGGESSPVLEEDSLPIVCEGITLDSDSIRGAELFLDLIGSESECLLAAERGAGVILTESKIANDRVIMVPSVREAVMLLAKEWASQCSATILLLLGSASPQLATQVLTTLLLKTGRGVSSFRGENFQSHSEREWAESFLLPLFELTKEHSYAVIGVQTLQCTVDNLSVLCPDIIAITPDFLNTGAAQLEGVGEVLSKQYSLKGFELFLPEKLELKFLPERHFTYGSNVTFSCRYNEKSKLSLKALPGKSFSVPLWDEEGAIELAGAVEIFRLYLERRSLFQEESYSSQITEMLTRTTRFFAPTQLYLLSNGMEVLHFADEKSLRHYLKNLSEKCLGVLVRSEVISSPVGMQETSFENLILVAESSKSRDSSLEDPNPSHQDSSQRVFRAPSAAQAALITQKLRERDVVVLGEKGAEVLQKLLEYFPEMINNSGP